MGALVFIFSGFYRKVKGANSLRLKMEEAEAVEVGVARSWRR